MRRALVTLGAIGVAGLVAIALSDVRVFLSRYAAREIWMVLEMAAVLATGLLAVTAAFFASVPGRSNWWSAAPLPFLAAWLALSGVGCAPTIGMEWRMGDSWHCLLFITGTSLVLAAPLAWLLSRARPLDPLRVALLAGLGTAALSTFLLTFFHSFDVTVIDLGVHIVAIAIVTATVAAFNRRALNPA